MDLISERMEMALSRIEEIGAQEEVDPAFRPFFAVDKALRRVID